MQPDNPLLTLAVVLIAGLPLAWMARQWIREWRDYRAGTLTPHHSLRPVPPTLREPWRWRFLWLYAAQAVAIGGLMWLSFFSQYADRSPTPPQAYAVVFATWTILVAFATAVLTRLWDRSAAALARRRAAARQRHEPPGEQLGVLRPGPRLHERP